MTDSMFFLSVRRRGRPPRAGVKSTERIEIQVTPDERVELERVAKENNTKVAVVIREAVNSFVADYCDRATPFARVTFGGPVKPDD